MMRIVECRFRSSGDSSAGMLPSRDLPDLGIVLPTGNSVLNHQTFAMTISQWRSPQNHTEFAQACLGDSASPY